MRTRPIRYRETPNPSPARFCRALILMLGLLCLCQGSALAQAAQKRPRKLTLMVYMCGSNLESGYGSASADLQEMLASGFDSDRISLLVMTGGAENWTLGFDPDGLNIHEIGSRGMRDVWRDEAASMGAPRTLTTLLNFGVDRYPAEHYALILWNHGGGPMEGVCWDELFSMDSLSLSELTQAINASNLPDKLSWIGFDACLMGSAEVASALAPCADYMIASQETEPAAGWNYAFLKGLEDDPDARATGWRIVDSYFEGLEDERETVTLACTDLSRVSEIAAAMTDFFNPISKTLDRDSFLRLSELRMSAVDFGKPVRGAGFDGYDLVDLGDLVRAYGAIPELSEGASALTELLAQAVVYCKSNEPGATGLSVYHPYANKAMYEQHWHGDYQKLDFSPGYRSYLNRFGGLLTGEPLADWSSLDAPEKDGDAYTLRLTGEQAANLSSARLLVLGSFRNNAYRPAYVPLYVGDAALDGSGALAASYSGQALYAADAQGDPISGPIGVFPGDRPGRYAILAHYLSDNDLASSVRQERVIYEFDEPADPSGAVETLSPKIWDNASQTYTSRIPFDEAEFALVGFWRDLRYLPDEAGTLPGFDDWPAINGLNYATLTLPQPWNLRFVDDQLTDTPLYVAFQITDAQQNQHCTPLLPLQNDNLNAVALAPASVRNDFAQLELTAELNTSPLGPGMNLIWRLTNLTDADASFQATPIVLNERRQTGTTLSQGTYGLVLSPGETVEGLTTLPDTALEGLESLDALRFDVTLADADSKDTLCSFPVRVQVRGCDAEALRRVTGQIADRPSYRSQTVETECGRFTLTAQPDSSGLRMILRAENTSDATCDFTAWHFCLGDRRAASYWSFDGLEPGLEAVQHKVIRRNDAFLYGLEAIGEVRCDLIAKDSQTMDYVEQAPLRFEFDGLDVGALAPAFYEVLAEAESGGLRWQLLSLQEDKDGRIRGTVCVTSARRESIEEQYVTVAADGVVIYNGILDYLDIPAGGSQIWTFDTRNDPAQSLPYIGFEPQGYGFTFKDFLPLDHPLNRHGVDEVATLTLTPRAEGLADAGVTLTLPEPLALRRRSDGMAMPEGVPVLEGPVRAELYAAAVGAKGMGLCVEFANDTDENVWLRLQNPAVGEQAVSFSYYGNREAVLLLPPHAVLDAAVEISTRLDLEEGSEIRDLSLDFDYGRGVDRAVIRGLDAVQGQAAGALYTADQLEAAPARVGQPAQPSEE